MLTDSGVATYTELFNCWLRASTRVKVSYGAGHIETIVSKLPLSPNDAAVLQQAYPHGWDTANVFGNIFFLSFGVQVFIAESKKHIGIWTVLHFALIRMMCG